MLIQALVLLSALSTALTGALQLHASPLIEAVPGTFYENGVGAPSVVWDEEQERYLMLFETPLDAVSTDCPLGMWGLGAAWSSDGQSWEVWPELILEPGGYDYNACAVAHPATLLEDGELQLWFKAHGTMGESGVGYGHGSITVLTEFERQEQLDTRRDDLDDALVTPISDYRELLLTYQSEQLQPSYGLLSDIDEDALDLGEDIDDRVNDLVEQIDEGAMLTTDVILSYLDTLLLLQELIDQLAYSPAAAEFLAASTTVHQATQDLTDFLVDCQIQSDTLDAKQSVLDAGEWQQGASFTLSDALVLPVTTRFGFPSVVKQGGLYTMLLAKVPNLYRATSTDRVNWTIQTTPVITPGVASWAPDALFNPSLTCGEGDYPYTNYFGGRKKITWRVVAGGWGRAISRDGDTWLVNALARVQFIGTKAWRHWDVMEVGDETVVWYSDKDDQGLSRIQLAYTDPVWDTADIQDRSCP
ncbi:MAG: hypothetical protein GWP91_11575 [Rhodobacterales bacterium]|nr:hypothetical protein [Rhodobacterales bacterium]